MRLTDTDTDPGLVARTINDLDGGSTFTLNAYWLAVVGERKDYAARLAPLLAVPDTPVLIVKARFDNANSIMNDLALILEQNRAAVLTAFGHDRTAPMRLSIVLLARSELAVAVSSSPVLWPEWVPVVGGTEVPGLITDITRRINVPLNEAGADAGKLNRALYAVEGALIRRLVLVTEQVPEAHLRLFDVIGRRSDVAWAVFIATVKSAHLAIASAESYRPSVRAGDSVVSRLWEVTQTGSGQDVDRAVAGLAEALHVISPDVLQGWHECLFGALARGHDASQNRPGKFARSTLFTISASCQYITCAAHAHSYPELPLNLITSVIDDLYGGLANIGSCLNNMPRVGLRRGDT
jgi:hypothetical protein